jgi:hypothetical protein
MMGRTESALAKARVVTEAYAAFRMAVGEFKHEEFDVRGLEWADQVDLHHATALTKVSEEGEAAAAVHLDWVHGALRDLEYCKRQENAEREKLAAIVRDVLAEVQK